MRQIKVISLIVLMLMGIQAHSYAADRPTARALDFYGDSIAFAGTEHFVDIAPHLSEPAIRNFYNEMEQGGYDPLIRTLLAYREKARLDDWLYYQLIRRTAEAISPKKENYTRYTLYKWYFLNESGYDAELGIAGDTLLFYVQCDENIYDIPYFTRNGRQYVCLNYHDYGSNLDLEHMALQRIRLNKDGGRSFSYRLTQAPGFKMTDYQYRDVTFDYRDVPYHFQLKLNRQVKNIYANYPVADYQLYFNAPMSRETYDSFVPKLKEITAGMNTRTGVDYLMRFTRYAFLYQNDVANFGKEKRLSPEQTLLYEGSDCEDHAALFFFLVKEIYNLPMIVLAYPSHVTIAVKLDKAPGKPIIYNGDKYYVCEPTPQGRDLNIGQVSKKLKAEPYEVAYAYQPQPRP